MTGADEDASRLARPGDTQWMHELRNELGTMMMATSATSRLLAIGMTDQAIENLQRIEAACQRCRALLP